jgi:hypothetical protein
MGRDIRLSDKAVVTHVAVVVRDGDSGGQVYITLAEFAALFSVQQTMFGVMPVEVAKTGLNGCKAGPDGG